MITAQINAYSLASNPAASTDNTSNSSSSAKSTKKSTLGMQDFLQLLSAQMANQDPMNPTDNTEFISQMAQFSSLSAMQTLTETAASQLSATNTASLISYSQYGAALVGKTVVAVTQNDDGTIPKNADGTAITIQGVVDSVNFLSNSSTVSINGKNYDLASVIKVIADPSKTPSTT